MNSGENFEKKNKMTRFRMSQVASVMMAPAIEKYAFNSASELIEGNLLERDYASQAAFDEDELFQDDFLQKHLDPREHRRKRRKAFAEKQMRKSLPGGKSSPKKNKKRTRSALSRSTTPRLPAPAAALMGQANAAYVQRKYAEAVKLLLQVIRWSPNSPEPYHTAGMCYEEWSTVNDDANDKDPEPSSSHDNMKLTAERKKRLAKACNYFLLAAHLDPASNTDGHRWLKIARLLQTRLGFLPPVQTGILLAPPPPSSASTSNSPGDPEQKRHILLPSDFDLEGHKQHVLLRQQAVYALSRAIKCLVREAASSGSEEGQQTPSSSLGFTSSSSSPSERYPLSVWQLQVMRVVKEKCRLLVELQHPVKAVQAWAYILCAFPMSRLYPAELAGSLWEELITWIIKLGFEGLPAVRQVTAIMLSNPKNAFLGCPGAALGLRSADTIMSLWVDAGLHEEVLLGTTGYHSGPLMMHPRDRAKQFLEDAAMTLWQVCPATVATCPEHAIYWWGYQTALPLAYWSTEDEGQRRALLVHCLPLNLRIRYMHATRQEPSALVKQLCDALHVDYLDPSINSTGEDSHVTLKKEKRDVLRTKAAAKVLPVNKALLEALLLSSSDHMDQEGDDSHPPSMLDRHGQKKGPPHLVFVPVLEDDVKMVTVGEEGSNKRRRKCVIDGRRVIRDRQRSAGSILMYGFAQPKLKRSIADRAGVLADPELSRRRKPRHNPSHRCFDPSKPRPLKRALRPRLDPSARFALVCSLIAHQEHKKPPGQEKKDENEDEEYSHLSHLLFSQEIRALFEEWPGELFYLNTEKRCQHRSPLMLTVRIKQEQENDHDPNSKNSVFTVTKTWMQWSMAILEEVTRNSDRKDIYLNILVPLVEDSPLSRGEALVPYRRALMHFCALHRDFETFLGSPAAIRWFLRKEVASWEPYLVFQHYAQLMGLPLALLYYEEHELQKARHQEKLDNDGDEEKQSINVTPEDNNAKKKESKVYFRRTYAFLRFLKRIGSPPALLLSSAAYLAGENYECAREILACLPESALSLEEQKEEDGDEDGPTFKFLNAQHGGVNANKMTVLAHVHYIGCVANCRRAQQRTCQGELVKTYSDKGLWHHRQLMHIHKIAKNAEDAQLALFLAGHAMMLIKQRTAALRLLLRALRKCPFMEGAALLPKGFAWIIGQDLSKTISCEYVQGLCLKLAAEIEAASSQDHRSHSAASKVVNQLLFSEMQRS